MSKHNNQLATLLRGASDANIVFADLRQLLIRLGFDERTRGNHHLFRKTGIEEKIICKEREGTPNPIK